MKRIIYLFLFFLVACNLSIDNTPDPNLEKFPLNLSWDNIDTNSDNIKENYVTSIKKQRCGDCFIYTAIGLLEIQYQIDHKIQLNLDLSEQNIHNCLRILCSDAGDDKVILDYIKYHGVVTESHVPTGVWGVCDNFSFLSDEYFITKKVYIPVFKFRSWYSVVNTKETNRTTIRRKIVKALQKGPVSISFGGWNGLEKSGDIIYCAKKSYSGHVAIVVGYKFHGKILLIKNSHGENSLLQLIYNENDGNECDIAYEVNQITPNSTYIDANVFTD